MKLSIRDLLLVTMIVALVVGWWMDRSRLAGECDRRKEHEVLAEITRMWNLPNSSAPAPNPPKP